MERITLYVPETLNDGSLVPIRKFEAYETELLEIVGGFTLTQTIGSWRSPSRETYREPIRLYAIDVPDAESVMGSVLELAGRIGIELAQENVYVTSSPIEVQNVTVVVNDSPAAPRRDVGEEVVVSE